jgi:hypothetical protein
VIWQVKEGRYLEGRGQAIAPKISGVGVTNSVD